MAKAIPQTKFRLEHAFAASPELSIDEAPNHGLLVGRNSSAGEFEAVFLGKQAERPYSDVWMDSRGAHVVYVMGKRRSGKSFTLGTLAEGLVADSWAKQGDLRQGVLILDTMNVYLTMPFGIEETLSSDRSEVKELDKWKLLGGRTSVTLFAPHGTPVPPGLLAEEISLRPSDLGPEEWCALFEVDPFTDPQGHLLTELHAKVAIEGYSDARNRRVQPKAGFSIGDFLTCLDSDVDIQGFPRDTREALRRRLSAVDRLPVFSDHGLDVRRLFRPGKVAVLLLRDLDQQMRSIMTALIIKRMLQLRSQSEQQERMVPVHEARAEKYERTDPDRAKEERAQASECVARANAGLPRSWLIIDEAHNYVPSKLNPPSRRPLMKYVTEGRNLGLSIVVATQQPSGLDGSIQRNADILIVHSLSHHDDIAAAEGMINTACPEEVTVGTRSRISGSRIFEKMVRSLPIGYALISTDRANRLFPARIRPRTTLHGGVDY